MFPTPAPPQDKAIGDSFPVDRNSKMRKAGQLRVKAGSFPDHIFLIPEVRRAREPHMCRKAPWRSKGDVMLRDVLPICLCNRIHWLRDMCAHTQGS